MYDIYIYMFFVYVYVYIYIYIYIHMYIPSRTARGAAGPGDHILVRVAVPRGLIMIILLITII